MTNSRTSEATMPPERAPLARNIMIFFAGLAAAGLVIGVLNGPFDSMVAASSDVARTSQAAQGRQWITSYWNALPFIVVFLAFFQLLGAAAAERRLR